MKMNAWEERVVSPEKRRKPVGAGLGSAGVMREGAPPARLPWETEKEYEWLLVYWREGASRSLRDMAAREGANWSTFCRARKRNEWDARVQAAIEEPPEVKQRWLERRERLREAEWKLHEECLEAGREAMKEWRESGKTASLGDLVKLLEFSSRQGRLAAGVADNYTMVTGEDGEPIRVQFEAALARAYGPVAEVAGEDSGSGSSSGVMKAESLWANDRGENLKPETGNLRPETGVWGTGEGKQEKAE